MISNGNVSGTKEDNFKIKPFKEDLEGAYAPMNIFPPPFAERYSESVLNY